MNVILSIKPKYVKHIIDGKKQFEFRKKPLPKSIERIFIYSSAPEKRIVAYFDLLDTFADTPKKLWRRFNKESGISSREFFNYYQGKKIGYAISISNLYILKKTIDPYKKIKNFCPPQSFTYLRKELKLK